MNEDIKKLKVLASDKTVLYVEDEEGVRESIGDYLKKLFKNVLCAENGTIGLEKYDPGTIDLVITDITMPEKNGLEMIKEIKAISPEQETVVVSAQMSTSCFLDSIHLGVDGYILKPIDHHQFHTELIKILNKIDMRHQIEFYQSSLETQVKEKTEHTCSLMKEKMENHQKTLVSLVELVEKRDSYTAGHSLRVANYCKIIAQELGCSSEECELIYEAGILHDIGKIGIPDSVLLKPGQFKELEYRLIKQHVEVGTDVLKNIPMYKDHVDVIMCHHERYDGKGYPNGLKADQIPMLAHIMMVADAFDAMTTNRIYKKRKSIQEAISELQKLTLKQFHPEVVEVVVDALEKIELDESATQLPKDELEKERFAYFYRDQITGAYNQTFLEVMLMEYQRELLPCYLHSVSIDDFGAYNKKFGWSKGDALLSDTSNYLRDNFDNYELFRVHADKFALLTRNEEDVIEQEFRSIPFSDKSEMRISLKLCYSGVPDTKDIENIDNIIYT